MEEKKLSQNESEMSEMQEGWQAKKLFNTYLEFILLLLLIIVIVVIITINLNF